MTRVFHLWALLAAVPCVAQVSQVRLDTTDAIPYRTLTRDDFRGLHPPKPFLTSQPVRPVAVSCAYVAADPRARIYAEPAYRDGQRYFRPRVVDLSFRAMLSRSCSWWNREHDVSPAYVLEHEQIHFALFEAAARKLNKEMPGLVAAAELEATSADAVVVAVQLRVQTALKRALEVAGEQNLQFDRATSFGFALHPQSSWRLRVEGDLEQFAEYAAPPLPPMSGRESR